MDIRSHWDEIFIDYKVKHYIECLDSAFQLHDIMNLIRRFVVTSYSFNICTIAV